MIRYPYQQKKIPIRLIGVDTPETVDPRKTVQCFGKEASAITQEYRDAENTARLSSKGLWASEACNAGTKAKKLSQL